MSSIVEHWKQLRGSVHPHDETVFASSRHSFNLDHPPPAYIGDIVNAPVVLLEANGGYDPIVTPSEFPDDEATGRYVDLLHNPRPVEPRSIAPYYGKRNYSGFIATGRLALVNAVAYRSPGISREPGNRRTADLLPSVKVHRKWLREELMPAAVRGERLVIIHRNSLWKISRREGDWQNVVFTTNPVSPDMSRQTLEKIRTFR